ncbi:protein At-4/1 isoform X2 [Humulus lupulus]|uniref:protein At-4/1 isoform X2 n=1 Tax=Humulus lupulus TaxID=3486 RepID=UPI002B40E874|nr:protein At-4/1 isoform X2 [Humulus lupulus]
MAGNTSGTIEEEMDSLLSTFDHIQEDFKSALMEIHRLKSSSNGEIKKREALELACKSLKQENERLTKLYTESLNNVVDQLEHRTTCQSLKERLKRMNDGCLSKEDERRKFESIKHEYAKKISDLETQIKGLVLEKATNEATLNQLRQDLGAHKSHIQYLAGRLERVHLNVESKYELEIQGLRDCITNEKEEKKELNNKLQQLEKEHQRLLSSNNILLQMCIMQRFRKPT